MRSRAFTPGFSKPALQSSCPFLSAGSFSTSSWLDLGSFSSCVSFFPDQAVTVSSDTRPDVTQKKKHPRSKGVMTSRTSLAETATSCELCSSRGPTFFHCCRHRAPVTLGAKGLLKINVSVLPAVLAHGCPSGSCSSMSLWPSLHPVRVPLALATTFCPSQHLAVRAAPEG